MDSWAAEHLLGTSTDAECPEKVPCLALPCFVGCIGLCGEQPASSLRLPSIDSVHRRQTHSRFVAFQKHFGTCLPPELAPVLHLCRHPLPHPRFLPGEDQTNALLYLLHHLFASAALSQSCLASHCLNSYCSLIESVKESISFRDFISDSQPTPPDSITRLC
ncbi:hypothetical protein CI102_5322 [Trichoderma harzianum]|nr:hypothetical protein CI102_5322 [Trichoderma harzianum]